MPQTTQNKKGIWLPNIYGKKFSCFYALGNHPPIIRHFYTDFENDSMSPIQVNGVDSLAIVTSNPFSGTKCLRGNLGEAFAEVDPITGKARNGSPANVGLRFLTDNACDNWESLFYRCKIRFDAANNLKTGGTVSTPKLAYFSDVRAHTSTQRSVWPTASPGSGLKSIFENTAVQIIPHDTGGGAIDGAATGCGFAYDGQWNTFEVLFVYSGGTYGFGYMEMWVNGVKWLASAGQSDEVINGVIPFKSDFRVGHIRIFHHNAESEFAESVNGAGEKCGWQMDELAIYEGDPR